MPKYVSIGKVKEKVRAAEDEPEIHRTEFALFTSYEGWRSCMTLLLGETIERGIERDAALATKILLDKHDEENASAVRMTSAQLAERMSLDFGTPCPYAGPFVSNTVW